jgi:nicotinate-nucleotide adenylyltransferase
MTFTPPHLLDSDRWAGMRIGLLGGSFNPPHQGHVHISLIAMQALKLDFIWWLATPQNPLKPQTGLMPYIERLQLCQALVRHPRILVSDLERQLRVNRTYDTVRALKPRFPRTSFVWLTGMDNAQTFHLWYRWRHILGEISTAHIARPPYWSLIRACPLAMTGTQNHVCLDSPQKADLSPGNTYWILQKKMVDISSTNIRKSLEYSIK